MIEIDGSFGEGGGQILRSALALAAVLGKEVSIFNIRAGRSQPGLRAQHLTSVKVLADICKASFSDLKIGSTKFVFRPGRIEAGSFRFDVGTAGSITLVLQTVMPLLPFAPRGVSLEVRGGTDVKWSPPIDYLRLVTVPLLAKMGMLVSIQTLARGHYPKGGGIVRLATTPMGPLRPVNGGGRRKVVSIVGVSHSVRLPRHVAERQAASAVQVIVGGGLRRPEIEIETSENDSHASPGSGIVLSAKIENGSFLGGDSLGEIGRPAEDVGRLAGETLVNEIESGCFLDRHMGDMIVPYVTLADGVSDVSVSQVTRHTLTNVKVAEWMAGVRFDTVGDLGKPGRLRVKGIGLRAGGAAVSPRESLQMPGP